MTCLEPLRDFWMEPSFMPKTMTSTYKYDMYLSFHALIYLLLRRGGMCKSKALDFLVMSGKLDEALHLAPGVLAEMRDDNLLKFQMPGKLFTISLVHIARGDWVALGQALTEYTESLYPAFEISREFALLQRLQNSALNFDPDQYQLDLDEYVKISPLDNWKLRILKQAKEALGNQDLT